MLESMLRRGSLGLLLLTTTSCVPVDSAKQPSSGAPATKASVTASVSSASCAPVAGTAVLERGCVDVCLGTPARLAHVCLVDDFGAVKGTWLPRKLTIHIAGVEALSTVVAFGPVDPPMAGDFSIVRLEAHFEAQGTSLVLTEDPKKSCTSAKASKVHDYAKEPDYQKAVDEVCAARGTRIYRDGKFVRAEVLGK